MKAVDFVLSKYPNAGSFPAIDNYRMRTSYVIFKGNGTGEIFPNWGAETASKAWTNAKKHILNGEPEEDYSFEKTRPK